MALAAMVMLAGCESGGGGGGGGGDFEGTWALRGSPTWYIHFQSGGTFSMSDNADGTAVRVTGTYSVSDGTASGPFTNPGTGDGRIEATITDNVLNLKFIEGWHTPNKVISYTGTKI
jgi:hypothetical protein